MRLGVFGGTFNPIHYGHLRAAEEVRDLCGLDRVLFLPSGVPPLKDTDLAAAGHRYAMTAAATASNRHFAVSDLELRDPGRSYTVNTLGRLRETHPSDEILLILGMDAFLEMPLWWKPETLVTMVDFILVSRPGHPVSDVSMSPYATGDAPEGFTSAAGASATAQPGISSPPGRTVCLTGGRKVTVVPVTSLDISSTQIRSLVRNGRSVTYLVPREVEDYILAHGLYRD